MNRCGKRKAFAPAQLVKSMSAYYAQFTLLYQPTVTNNSPHFVVLLAIMNYTDSQDNMAKYSNVNWKVKTQV